MANKSNENPFEAMELQSQPVSSDGKRLKHQKTVNPFTGIKDVEEKAHVEVKSLKKVSKDPFPKNEYQDPLKDVRSDLSKTKSNKDEDTVTVLEWFASILLLFIPVVGIIAALYFMLSEESTKSKKNWAKANLIIYGICFIGIIIFYVLACTVWYPYFSSIS